METSKITSTDKATVVIQVNPQVTQNTVMSDDGQEARGTYHNTALAEFFKVQPKALGTVQIMIGVVCFLFGSVYIYLNSYHTDFIVHSGIIYCGSLIYISAGSLSVAAQNKLISCVVKASLIMNVISAMTAGAATVLMSIWIIQSDITSEFYYRCYLVYRRVYGYGHDYDHGYGHDSYTKEICLYSKRYDLGISGIFLVFSILQFIISICISGFACKATCNRDSTVVNVTLNQGY